MKRDRQRWGWPFWTILAAGAWLGAGLGAVKTAEATDLFSGLLKSNNGGVHCAVLNIGTAEITVDIAIINGSDGSICNSTTTDIQSEEARGVGCDTSDGAYCVVSGTFTKTKVRAKFSARDGDDNDTSALKLR